MSSNPPYYVALLEGDPFPDVGEKRPFKAVLIAEIEVSKDWQTAASDWLVRNGCLYMMAWGVGCSSWDDAVDHANLALFGYGDIPEEAAVMTTWHADESLSEVFWFAKCCARHPVIAIRNTILVHIGVQNKRTEFVHNFTRAALGGDEF